MDPNEALRRIREIVEKTYDKEMSSASVEEMFNDLVDHFEALDDWLTKGGFLPNAWIR